MNRLKKIYEKNIKKLSKRLIYNLIKIGLEIFNEKLFDINNGMWIMGSEYDT